MERDKAVDGGKSQERLNEQVIKKCNIKFLRTRPIFVI
jgi:hypothetical protein